MELRPLGFGEIFDRAITLYIRNFVPFCGIVMVLVVPLSILQYVIDRGNQPEFDAMLRILQHPDRARTEHLPTIFDSPGSILAVALVSVLVAYLIWPFALNAVAVGVARLYRNRPVEFRACYEAVLRRWLQIVALIGIELLVLLAWYVATVTIVILVILFASMVASYAGPVGVWFGFFAAIFIFVVMLPLLAPLMVALIFAMYSVVIEGRAVVASLSLGFSRVFNRNEFWRALLFSIAAGAIVFAGSAMLGFLSLAAAFLHLTVVEVFIDGLSRALIAPFAVVLLAVYYYDVRIRHEAFDIEASLERLTAGANVA
jgi:hypothetical protein